MEIFSLIKRFVEILLVVRIDKNEEHEFGKKRRRENLELDLVI